MVEVYWHFRGRYCFHLQDQKRSEARNRSKQSDFVGSIFLQNSGELLSDYSIKAQKIALSTVAAMRTTNPTQVNPVYIFTPSFNICLTTALPPIPWSPIPRPVYATCLA
jgi:hypothetical protein